MTDREAMVPQLDEFFVNSVDLLAVYSADGAVGVINPAWSRVLGWDLERLQSRPIIEFVHPADVARTNEETASIFASSETTRFGFENRLACNDGDYRWFEWTTQRRGDLVYATGRDVTRRRSVLAQLDESLKMTNAIFTAAADSIIVVDENLVIAQSSPGGRPLFGYPGEGRVGEFALDIVHPDDLAKATNALRRIFDHEQIAECRFRARHFDGHWMYIEARGGPLMTADGRATLAVIINRDVSASVVEAMCTMWLASFARASFGSSGFVSWMAFTASRGFFQRSRWRLARPLKHLWHPPWNCPWNPRWTRSIR